MSIDSKLQTKKNIRGGFSFIIDFKKPIFARLFSLNFSSKECVVEPVPLKFESYNLQRCKNSCRKLFFRVSAKQLLSHIICKWLHCYKVTLVKNYTKPLLQKSETKIFDQKRFIKIFCCKPCWNAERSNHSFLPILWITFFHHMYSLICNTVLLWLSKKI